MTGGPGSVSSKPKSWVNPFDTSSMKKSKTDQDPSVSTPHCAPPCTNKIIEQKFQNPSTITIVEKNFQQEEKELLTTLRKYTPVQILLEQRPDMRGSNEKRIYAMFDWLRTYKEATLSSFALDPGEGVVKGLLEGKLNDYQMTRVMDRVRYLAVYGTAVEKGLATNILLNAAEHYMTGIAMPKGKKKFDAFTKKLENYYGKVIAEFDEALKKNTPPNIGILKQLTGVDRMILSRSSAGKDLLATYFDRGEYTEYTTDKQITDILNQLRKEFKKRTQDSERASDEMRDVIIDESIEKYGVDSTKTLDYVEDFESRLLTGDFDMGDEDCRKAVFMGVCMINEQMCLGDAEEEKNFDTIRYNPRTAFHVSAYCRQLFHNYIANITQPHSGGYKETMSLKQIIALPILIVALEGSVVDGTTDDLRQILAKNLDRESMRQFNLALTFAQEQRDRS